MANGFPLTRAGQPSDITTGQDPSEVILGDLFNQQPTSSTTFDAPIDLAQTGALGDEEFQSLLGQEMGQQEEVPQEIAAPGVLGDTEFQALLEQEVQSAAQPQNLTFEQRVDRLGTRLKLSPDFGRHNLSPEQGVSFNRQLDLGLFNTDSGKESFLGMLYGPGNVRLKDDEFEFRENSEAPWQRVLGGGVDRIINMAARFSAMAPQVVGSIGGAVRGAALTGGSPLGLAVGAGVGSIIGDASREGMKHMAGLDKFEPSDDEAVQQIFARGALEMGFAGAAGAAQVGTQLIGGANLIKEGFERPNLFPGIGKMADPEELTGPDLLKLVDEFGIEVLPSQVSRSRFVEGIEAEAVKGAKGEQIISNFINKQIKRVEEIGQLIIKRIVPRGGQRLSGRQLSVQIHNNAIKRKESNLLRLIEPRKKAIKRAQGQGFIPEKFQAQMQIELNKFKMLDAQGELITKWNSTMKIDKQTHGELIEFAQILARKTEPTFKQQGMFSPTKLTAARGLTIDEIFNLKTVLGNKAKFAPGEIGTERAANKGVLRSLYEDLADDYMDIVGKHLDEDELSKFITDTKIFTIEKEQLVELTKLAQQHPDDLAEVLVRKDSKFLEQTLPLLDDTTHANIALSFVGQLIDKSRTLTQGRFQKIGGKMVNLLSDYPKESLDAVFGFHRGPDVLNQVRKFARVVDVLEKVPLAKFKSLSEGERQVVTGMLAIRGREYFMAQVAAKLLRKNSNAAKIISREGFNELLTGFPKITTRGAVGSALIGSAGVEAFAEDPGQSQIEGP